MIASLNDLFVYADIEYVGLTSDDTVYIEARHRRSGARICCEGVDLDDAVDIAVARVEDMVWTIDTILDQYNLTLEELAEMVDFNLEPPHLPLGSATDPRVITTDRLTDSAYADRVHTPAIAAQPYYDYDPYYDAD